MAAARRNALETLEDSELIKRYNNNNNLDFSLQDSQGRLNIGKIMRYQTCGWISAGYNNVHNKQE